MVQVLFLAQGMSQNDVVFDVLSGIADAGNPSRSSLGFSLDNAMRASDPRSRNPSGCGCDAATPRQPRGGTRCSGQCRFKF